MLVGDSGVRTNGTAVRRLQKDLDLTTTTLRQRAWMRLAERGTAAVECEVLSRRITMLGTGQPAHALAPVLNEADLARIATEMAALCESALPNVPPADIAKLIDAGIAGGQGRYQNNTTEVLGYSALDGCPVPEKLMQIETLPRSEVGYIELFTDGYFEPGEGFGVAAWKAAFRQTEEVDPGKIKVFLSPRGSDDGTWSDDRTYLGVEL